MELAKLYVCIVSSYSLMIAYASLTKSNELALKSLLSYDNKNDNNAHPNLSCHDQM